MFTLLEIAISIGVLVIMISALTACVCGCKNSNQNEMFFNRSELVGTAGVVKLRFDEEVPSPTPTTPASVKRASTQNSQRSLPEIPHPVGRHDSGDTASEIYATVNLDEGNKVVATTSSGRDHPYEHAYAKLQNEAHSITVEITPDPESENVIQIDEREATQSGPESVVISASVAISGQLPSSQELPYITPPSPRPNTDNTVHFSGDSTDSAKGYTSISVREPLSNIRAQVAKPLSQPHYATVSDDSDEMYAAIEEASMGGGSDTYAQIANNTPDILRTEAILHTNTSSRRSAPPEITASTSSATHQTTQSRPDEQPAASSSCSGSVSALGSPKPEKRQANSPLPPPPTHPTHPARVDLLAHTHQRINSTGDLFNQDKLRRSVNEKHQRNNSCVSSSDFYGCNYPVEKHRFSSGDLVRPLVAKELNFDLSDNHYNSIEASNTNDHSIEPSLESASPSRNLDDMYAKVNKKKHKDEPDEAKHKFRANDPGYETIDRKNHGYETIARKDHKQDPGYETVKDVKSTLHYNNNNLKLNQVNVDSGPNSIISSDPGYEHISKTDHNASDSDPNYEVLRNNPSTPPYATIAPDYKVQPTYSTVIKKQPQYNNWPANNNEEIVEPNYESMPHDPLYTTGSESDPNYESVRPKYENHDPNYESLRSKNPKYESIGLRDSTRSKKDPNYESVKYFDVSKSDPPYERVRNDTSSSGIDRSDSAAGYEKINVQNNTKNSINGANATVGDYFQV